MASGESVRDLEVTGRVSPRGRTGTFLLSADAIRDAAGGVAGANLSVVEITARKRREDALSELAEARRHALTIDQSIPYGTWIADPHGAMRFLSESFLRMVGIAGRGPRRRLAGLPRPGCRGPGPCRLAGGDLERRRVG